MPSYVITGASRGIGLEFVRQLSTSPTNVVFGLVRNKASSQALLDLDKERKNVHVLEADVRSFTGLKAAAAEVSKVTGGTLEYLINNAAYIQPARGEYDLTTYAEKGEENLLEKDFDDHFKVNVVGVIHTTNAFLPLLKKAAETALVKVVTLSSGLGDADLTLASRYAEQAPYSASKAAVNMVVAKYAALFSDHNVVFLAISPGVVDTAVRPPTPEQIEKFIEFTKIVQETYPDWDGKPLTPETSVRLVLGVVDKSERKDSGAFISHWGNKKWV